MVLSSPASVEVLDSVQVDPAHHEVLIENDQVRVVRWVVAPGDTTLYHSHPDNLNICLTDYNGKVTVEDAAPVTVRAKAGSVEWRQHVYHAVANLGDRQMVGIIVEPKQPASLRPAGSPDPLIADPEHHTVEFENHQIRVLRERRRPGSLPAHGHPDNVQVLLTDWTGTITTADGKTLNITGKAGDVRWRSAAEHSGTILGVEPVEQIIVEMKGRSAGY